MSKKSKKPDTAAEKTPLIEYPRELAEIPTAEVARIAAGMLSEYRNMDHAIEAAYQLLDRTERFKFSLRRQLNPETMEDYRRKVVELSRSELAAIDYPISDSYGIIYPNFDSKGNEQTVPFERGLAALIPKPGTTFENQPTERERLFKEYLKYRSIKFGLKTEEQAMIEAGKLLARWKKENIPPDDFHEALSNYSVWRKEKRSLINSKNRKGKQGSVKSKSDKRLRARPPKLTDLSK